jgi:hypothetical protein
MAVNRSQITYSVGSVVATLLMIESPTTTVYEAVHTDEISKTTSDADFKHDVELVVVQPKAVTSNIRSTICHLRDKAGVWSRFRGLSIYLIHAWALSCFSDFLGPITTRPIAAIVGGVMLARYRLGWNHIVISEPSPQAWFRRLPEFSKWRQVAIPTALLVTCEQLQSELPIVLFRTMRLDERTGNELSTMNCHEKKMIILQLASLVALWVVTFFSLVVPATVALTRVQASLIEEDTIIPFDKTFGGKIDRTSGDSPRIGMLDAWKTFGWNSRVRLLKLYAKVFAMQLATMAFFAIAIVGELHMIMGQDGFGKAVARQELPSTP